MVDYPRALATARRLILGAGRSVSLIQLSATPADASNPLHGPAGAPVATVTGVSAVFVEPSSLDRLGISVSRESGMWKNSKQIALVAPDADNNDFAKFHQLVDSDGTGWFIKHVEKLQPGDTTLLYFIGVAR